MSTYKLSKRENEALLELRGRNGQWSDAKVFEAARPVDHPLHNRFIWDKDKAWREKNLEIAQGLIRSVVFERITSKRGVVTVKRIPVVRHPEKAHTYTPADEVTRRSSKLAVVMAEAKAAESHLRRAFYIADQFGLGAIVEAAIVAVMNVKEAAEEAAEPQREAAE